MIGFQIGLVFRDNIQKKTKPSSTNKDLNIIIRGTRKKAIKTLNHELLDDTMELGSCVVLSVDSLGGEGQKIFDRFGTVLAEQAENYSTGRLVTDNYVKINLIRNRVIGGLEM